MTGVQTCALPIYKPQQATVTSIEVVALILSGVWLLGAAAFFMLSDTGAETTGADGLRFLITMLAVFMPVAMIWVAATAARSSRVMREESFGPVVGIMSVKGDAEAITLMNDSDFGLTASVWTQDAMRAEAIADQIETGTVFMNRADYPDPGLCWTGCKDTGRGGGLSVIGYHNLTRPKSYHLKKA